MKRFAAITMVLILSFAMFTSAVAETKGFHFAKLNRTGVDCSPQRGQSVT